jgi:soluble lytic murein transglycosylase
VLVKLAKKRKHKFILYLVLLSFILAGAYFSYYTFQRVYYPVKYKEAVLKYSKEFNIEPALVLAIIKAESNFRPDAVSKKNAIGLMQVTEETGAWIAVSLQIENYQSEMLLNPDINIRFGCKYLRYLFDYKAFFGNRKLAIAAYNCGQSRMKGWLDSKIVKINGNDVSGIPYEETANYLDKVSGYYNNYITIYASELSQV